MTAMQMESPKPPQQGPQQGPPGKKGPMPQQGPPPGYPPNMLPPQQLRGTPPPPYMHQPVLSLLSIVQVTKSEPECNCSDSSQ